MPQDEAQRERDSPREPVRVAEEYRRHALERACAAGAAATASRRRAGLYDVVEISAFLRTISPRRTNESQWFDSPATGGLPHHKRKTA